jgi:23S rRNA pseudouridine2605 synthase
MLIRLQKILAQAGFGSRRACETFITEGRVLVDGKVVQELGSKADPESQTISLDGQRIAGPGRTAKTIQEQRQKVYYVLNKPKGVLCTNEDPSGRPLAVQLVPEKRRIFCVGRLDKETEGLLLLTNDGDLTQELTHPRYGVPKVYVAKVEGMASGAQIDKLRAGVFLSEGRTQGAAVRIRKRTKKTSVLELTITEGRNREVRRVLAAVGLRCRSLKRVRIGPIRLARLSKGEHRRLVREEVESLKKAVARARNNTAQQANERKFGRTEKGGSEKRPSHSRQHRPWEKGSAYPVKKRNKGSPSKDKRARKDNQWSGPNYA